MFSKATDKTAEKSSVVPSCQEKMLEVADGTKEQSKSADERLWVRKKRLTVTLT
jgi:hypothetical protein